jgi:hypothetical protein
MSFLFSVKPSIWFLHSVGYLKFGFNREEGGIVYREWAPAAQ